MKLLSGILLSCLSAFVFAEEPVKATQGMVVSEHYLASQAGVDILRAGGNAIDAAVAVGYALAVVDPCCGNLGGSGFMTIHLANGKNLFINFRSRAPLLATSKMFQDKKGNLIPGKSTVGYLSVATPGTVMGFETARQKYGTQSREALIAPAIKLAENGYPLTERDIHIQTSYLKRFQQQPNIAAIYLKNNKLRKVGDNLIQKNLANTLKLISAQGTDVFYKGKIANAIVAASQKNHGLLSLKDFASYYVTEPAPISCTYHGYNIISAPPPSSGGLTLCEMLNILEKYPLRSLGLHSAASVHYMTEAMRDAFYDRNVHLGDPDFIQIPTDLFLSKERAETLRSHIKTGAATPSGELGNAEPQPEGMQTTHYSVIDKWGNAVAVTYTLNGFFGAQVIAGNTGFFLNDDMDDFAAKPGTRNQYGLIEAPANAVMPGKRPLSSMTPTIVLKDGKVVMIVGSPGGPRIITATMQAIVNVLDYGMNIQDAVDAPRFHHQWLPDAIDIEPQLLSTETQKQLAEMGYQFTPVDMWGAVEAIAIDPSSGAYYGANDKRRPSGQAIGY